MDHEHPMEIVEGAGLHVFHFVRDGRRLGYMVLSDDLEGIDVLQDIRRGLALLYHGGMAYQVADGIIRGEAKM
jgi:hypothetical protein